MGYGVHNGHKIDFLSVLSLLSGSLTFEKVAERPGITWHRSGHPRCLNFEEKMAKNGTSKFGIKKTGIWDKNWNTLLGHPFVHKS